MKAKKLIFFVLIGIFTVIFIGCPPFDGTDDSSGNSEEIIDAITLPLPEEKDKYLELTNYAWINLLEQVSFQNKYVILDLKDCTYKAGNQSGGLVEVSIDDDSYVSSDDAPKYIAFDPLPKITLGKNKIVSIILPDNANMIMRAAKSVSDETEEEDKKESAFLNFNNLRSISGENIVLIGNYAFYDCKYLQEVNLPRVGHNATPGELKDRNNDMVNGFRTDIGHYSFKNCTALKKITFNNAAVIGRYAFKGCINLTEIIFPKAWMVAQSAFEGCASLNEIRLESASKIGDNAFKDCVKLRNAYFDVKPEKFNDTIEPLVTIGEIMSTYDTVIFYPSSFAGCKAFEKLDVRNAWNVYFHENTFANSSSGLEIHLYDDDSASPDQYAFGHPQTRKFLGEGASVSVKEINLFIPLGSDHIKLDNNYPATNNIANFIEDEYKSSVDVSIKKRNM
jgi:hypothetical protein